LMRQITQNRSSWIFMKFNYNIYLSALGGPQGKE
jgi:hypothetical protein